MRKNKTIYIALLGLIGVIVLSGAFLMSSNSFAADNTDIVDEINITVPISCTMSGTGMTSHNANIANGTYQADIGSTTLKAFCNDSEGFSIYAIGFTDNEYGKTVLTNSTLGSTYDIATGTATSGNTSTWAMELATNSNATYLITIDNSFDNYHVVPSLYTKVAHRDSGTDVGTNATGTELTSTYAAYMNQTQPAGTYSGKVKYTMVHPNTAPTPIVPPSPASSCNTPVPGVTYMQDITSSNKATILGNMTPGNAYYLRDNRDEEPYCVSLLADNNLWMLDNLRLDITDSTVLNSLTTTNTHVDADSLISLKSGNRYAGSQYADGGAIAQWDSNNTTDYYNRAAANAASKDNITTSYGNGSGKIGVYYNYCAASAGSYCYDEGAGVDVADTIQDASYDLCPANWHMPTGGSSGEYNTLYATGYSSDATNFKIALSLPLSGFFGSGSPTRQGSSGIFWTSTYHGALSFMYYLGVTSSSVSNTDGSFRYRGNSLRCLLDV